MGPPSYIRSIIDPTVVMRHMTLLSGLVSLSEVHWQFVLMMFEVEHQFPVLCFQLCSVTTLSVYISLLTVQ